MDKVYELNFITEHLEREKPYSICINKTRHTKKGMFFHSEDIGEYDTREEALKAIGGNVDLVEYYVDSDVEIEGELLK